MRILVTGAFGIVGASTIEELLRQNHEVRIFDLPTKKNKRLAPRFKSKIDIVWGDIRNQAEVEAAVAGMDAVIHLAAIIPPLADKQPALAESVNVGGTETLVRALERLNPAPRLLFTSSIAVYGDRLAQPYISLEDPFLPNPDDHYAQHKIRCESLIRASRLPWTIFRLSYIVSLRKLRMDPIMFDIPLATSFEICDSADMALALANALASPATVGRTYHIAGGPECRITYREYLSTMLELFGVGNKGMPERAFKTSGFHCGFMDTAESQRTLRYQRCTLADYFAKVGRKMRVRRFFLQAVRSLAQRVLYARSPLLKPAAAKGLHLTKAPAGDGVR